MSTALAVGNILNRGTARSGVAGVVLPDSLLKLEELRGNVELTGEAGEKSGSSVLDFVAQALVNEDNGDLQRDAENLLSRARYASGISLEEAEANFRQVSGEVKKTQLSLNEIPESPGKTQIAKRVNGICEEVGMAQDLAEKVRADLAKTQRWSCCKGQIKSDDWFASWVQFLEIFVRALAKAQDVRARSQDEERKRIVHEEKGLATQNSEARQVLPSSAVARQPLCNVNVEEAAVFLEKTKTVGGSRSRSGSSSRMSGGCILDDDAKMSKVDLAQLLACRPEFPDKENSSR